MTDLSVNRWFRYGMRRLYVQDEAGDRVGWVDLDSGETHLDKPELCAEFEQAIAAAAAEPSTYVPRRAAGDDLPAAAIRDPEPEVPVASPMKGFAGAGWEDLSLRVPGQGAREKAVEEAAAFEERKGRLISVMARVFDVPTSERSWRIGADGEETVGARLDRLRREGWQLLHSVPVGGRGADIDHVLIGPAGMFTVNTKHHPKARVVVTGSTVKVDGQYRPYLKKSRDEAVRAAKLMTKAVGFTVPVHPVLVFVVDTLLPRLTIAQRPDDVLVVDQRDVPRVFRNKPQDVLGAGAVAELFEAARRSTTWVA